MSHLFSLSLNACSIWPIDRTLLGATTPGQSGPGSDGNEGVLHIPQSSSITGASSSDCLMSYLRHLIREGLTPLQRCNVSYNRSQLGYHRSDFHVVVKLSITIHALSVYVLVLSMALSRSTPYGLSNTDISFICKYLMKNLTEINTVRVNPIAQIVSISPDKWLLVIY